MKTSDKNYFESCDIRRAKLGLPQEIMDAQTKSSGKVEYYTPRNIIEAARATMGGIDLDRMWQLSIGSLPSWGWSRLRPERFYLTPPCQ